MLLPKRNLIKRKFDAFNDKIIPGSISKYINGRA